MSLKDLSITRKLALAFAVVVIAVLASSLAVFMSLRAVGGAFEANERSHARLDAASAALQALVEQQNAVRGFVSTGDESFPNRASAFAATFASDAQTLSTLSETEADRSRVSDLVREAATVNDQDLSLIAERRSPATATKAVADVATVGRLTQIREILKSITDPQTAALTEAAATEKAAFSNAVAMLLTGAVATLLLSIACGFVLTRGIAGPVVAMTGAMKRLSSGDNGVEIPAVGRGDEVGQMAGAVQTFKEAAIEKVRLEAEAVEQRRVADEAREKTEAERARAAQLQAQVVGDLATGLSRLADGVLTFRLSEPFSAEYEKLRSDFNAAMEQLQDTMKIVAANTAAIRSGTGEITQASDDLSRRTEQQAASLEETAAALDQITATVRKTAQGAGEARDVVSQAKTDAEHSGAVVREAVSAMAEIETSAQQISQIIGVIDEIAFQTNLLALNAGVEAARAGDAGKGFAVVASEVRALAQRSAEAAKEIKALISASSQQVDKGVNLVGETGKALERIVTQVAQINGVVAEIAASAQEQATGLQQVNTAVNQMDQVTQQNAAMVEQSTAASHALAQETEELARLIGRFEVGEEAKVQALAPRRAAKTRPALKTIGRGGAAPRPQPAHDEQNWDEF
ncbi:MAG TPA: methyl-accepting chemotaxis protein, partial [Caulobacteraceae bacterium]|nr:methyl-accepting chemotaxis protein [Caulobacteraceae bacterium]